jgi:hypothetical protein
MYSIERIISLIAAFLPLAISKTIKSAKSSIFSLINSFHRFKILILSNKGLILNIVQEF